MKFEFHNAQLDEVPKLPWTELSRTAFTSLIGRAMKLPLKLKPTRRRRLP